MAQVSAKEVEKALKKALGSFGLDRVEVVAGYDHDGEAALFVTAVLPPRTPPLPGDVSGSASVAVAQALENAGDERLSYLYLQRPDDERPLDERSAVASQ